MTYSLPSTAAPAHSHAAITATPLSGDRRSAGAVKPLPNHRRPIGEPPWHTVFLSAHPLPFGLAALRTEINLIDQMGYRLIFLPVESPSPALGRGLSALFQNPLLWESVAQTDTSKPDTSLSALMRALDQTPDLSIATYLTRAGGGCLCIRPMSRGDTVSTRSPHRWQTLFERARSFCRQSVEPTRLLTYSAELTPDLLSTAPAHIDAICVDGRDHADFQARCRRWAKQHQIPFQSIYA